VIGDPVNDRECLDQLTTFARELAPTTLIQSVARRLATREAVITWFQSLPQADDDGDEHVRFIQCDVPQRARLLPDDPNCVERSLGALMLLEAIDPKTLRALATIDKPLRHTGLVERVGAHWRAVDLFPRRNATRNFDWGKFGGDVLQGVHSYVGKPILKFYLGDTGGQVADTLGEQEDKLIGREKKKSPEKNGAPPAAGKEPQREQTKPGQSKPPSPRARRPAANRSVFAALVGGAGATQEQPIPSGGGGKDGEKEQGAKSTGAAAVDGAAGAGTHRPPAGDGDGGHQNGADARETTPSGWWWFLDRR
jgi:hypothetical protein